MEGEWRQTGKEGTYKGNSWMLRHHVGWSLLHGRTLPHKCVPGKCSCERVLATKEGNRMLTQTSDRKQCNRLYRLQCLRCT